MNWIAGIDFLTLLVVGGIILVLRRAWPCLDIGVGVKVMLVIFLFINLLHHLTNFLYWSGITAAFYPYEDYAEILQPIAWAAVCYAFVQEYALSQIRQERDTVQQYWNIAGISIVAVDLEGRITMVNPAAAELLGFPGKEVLGRNFFDYLVPETERSTWKRAFQELIAGQRSTITRGENWVRLRNAEEKILSWTATILRDPSGKITGILGAGLDLTETRRLEKALLTTKAHERALIDNIPHLAWVKDVEGKFVLVNKAFAKSCGFDIRQIIGKTDLDVWPHDLAERYRADDAEVMRTQEKKFVEEPIEEKSGIKWVETFKSPIFDPQGNLLGTTGIALDITARKKAEQAFKESAAQFRALIETTGTGYVIIDGQGRVWDANAEYVRLTGHRELNEIIGRNVLDWTAEYEREKNAAAVQACREQGFIRNFEIDYVDAKGRLTPIELNGTVVRSGDKVSILTLCRDISERKKAEQALRDNEQKFRTLFEHMNEGVALHEVVTDGSGRAIDYRIVDVNPAYERHTGLKPEMVCGLLGSVVYGEKSAPFLEEFSAVARTGTPLLFDKFFEPLQKHFSISVFSPQPGYFATVFEDVTERRQAQEELFNSREMLRLVLDNIPQRVFWKDRNSVYLGCNKPLAKDCGYDDPAQLIGKTDYETSSAANAELYRADDRQVMVSGQAKLDYEEPQIKPDGTAAWLKTSKVPLRDQSQRIMGVLCTYEDITASKQVEQALRDSEEKYRAIIQAADDAIFVADAQTGDIVDVNPRGEDLIGLAREKIIGMNQSELHPKGESKYYQDMFRRHSKEESFRKLVGYVYHRKKGNIPVHITTGVFELQGRQFIMGMFRDITELKMIEEALREDKAGLEKMVREKNLALGKTMKELEDAKRLSDIGALAATVAHELRNPLGVIKTAVYNIKQKSKDGTLERHLANIDKKINESERIIKTLLSYAQIKTPAYETVNILEVLNECVDHCRHKYADSEVNVVVKPRGTKTTLTAQVDTVHLNELFANILDNSYQAFPDHRGTINIDLDCQSEQGVCRITIQDNGTGIDREILPNIYDPFFTTKARGTGLGLSVCNQIINLYSGAIDIQSVKGQGTTVTLTLPIKKKGQG